MSFSCRTQLPVMTLVPTNIFVGNLFQAFVMYARLGLPGSRRFGLVLTGTSTVLGQKQIDQLHLNYYDGLSLFKDVCICLRFQRKLGNHHRSRQRTPAIFKFVVSLF